ncbi:MAG: TatD family hydrolase [Cyclobacteriaceae bacterium]|nr:TatD family hydrolase [Cyclobacteriaceae bacterium]MBX2954881.1 TatD family hydrolase [Cyclobacteriaceae bacterium]
MNFYIDTHAHIYLEEFDGDRTDMLSRATAAGVEKIFMPNIDHTSIDRMLELELKSEGLCLPMMGLHPCSIKKDFEKELYQMEYWITKRKFSAIGEMGTDLYWDKTFWEQQQEAFRIQVGWAKEHKLPIVIHSRDSLDQTIELVEQLKDDSLTGVFHCFTGTEQQAKRIFELGFYVGLGGVATFKNGGMEKVIPSLMLDKIVLETDSPYLAPVPHRGKRNEPAYIPLIATKVADLKNLSLDEVKRITTQNATKLFS